MKTLLAAIALVALFACSKQDDKPAPAAAPVPAAGPAAGSAATGSADQIQPQAMAEAPREDPGPCMITLKVSDQVAYESGPIKGSTSLRGSDLSALKPLAGNKCVANITATDDVQYQDLIGLMDGLIKIGITDVGLDDAKGARKAPPPKVGDMPAIHSEWKDGKLTLTGKFDEKVPLKSVPIIIMTTTDVTIGGKKVGKVDEGAPLAAKISAALPASPKDPIIIIQADRNLTYAPIKAAVEGAKAAGYDNVLFAVKNK